MNKLFSIEKKVILITGGAGILGLSMADYFTSQGSQVIILDRDISTFNLSEDGKTENGIFCLTTDVLDKAVLQKNYETIIAKFGTIDVLINAAGGNMAGATIAPDKTIFDLDIDALKKVVDLNLMGTILPTMVFSQIMAKNKSGVIINISSESALRPLTRVVGYGAAKSAVTNFTKYMAGEMAIKFGEGIRVNAIAPGFFLTNQNRTLLTNSDGTYTDRAKTILNHTPFGRFGSPEELHGTLQWLASDASKFVTGTVTVIDGGFDAFSI